MRRRPALPSILVALLAVSACGPAGPDGPAGTVRQSAVPEARASASATGAAPDGTFTLLSPAVSGGRLLPEYRCEPKVNGEEASIPLAWSNVPDGTGSLAVVMHHYPFPDDRSRVGSYLLLWGIAPSVTGIPHGGAAGGDWFMGANKDGTAISYTSPCSRGAGTHEYTITLYALSETPPSLPAESSLDVTYPVLAGAIAGVDVRGTATLTFTDTTP